MNQSKAIIDVNVSVNDDIRVCTSAGINISMRSIIVCKY